MLISHTPSDIFVSLRGKFSKAVEILSMPRNLLFGESQGDLGVTGLKADQYFMAPLARGTVGGAAHGGGVARQIFEVGDDFEVVGQLRDA